MVCPIKLLLTLALRLENVAENSIEDLLMHTARRNNRTVLWSFPERPVLCAFSSAGAAPQVESPAGNHQLSQTMGQASLVAGLLSRLRAHDLCRGAARDTANLNSEEKGVVNTVTAAVLGHNVNGSSRQGTAHYVGDLDDDVWSKRVDENYVDSIHGVAEAEHAYQRRFQSFKAQDITEACQSEGLDPQEPKGRKLALRKLEKRRQADWADQETRKRQMLATDSPAAPPSPDDDHNAPGEVSDESPTTTANQVDSFSLDPQLAQDCNDFCNVMTGADDGATNPAIQDLLLDSVQTDAAVSPTQESGEPDDALNFVRRFSTINISCNQGLQNFGGTESNLRHGRRFAPVCRATAATR